MASQDALAATDTERANLDWLAQKSPCRLIKVLLAALTIFSFDTSDQTALLLFRHRLRFVRRNFICSTFHHEFGSKRHPTIELLFTTDRVTMAYKLPIEDAKKESDRCWKVATETYDRAAALVVIKQKLGKTAEIGNIIAHLKDISSLLRDCTDLLLVFKNRIYLFDEYLDAALQSINHTNRVLIHLLGDEDFLYADTAESRWKYLLVKMENEVGVPLLNRVVIYQSFLAELVNLIEQ